MKSKPSKRLLTELYELTHRGHPGDEAFYVNACRGARHVLELGCGTGRLLVPLAKVARRVTGLELEPSMLQAAERKLEFQTASVRRRVDLCRGDMARIALGKRFDRIVLPYNALYCLLSRRGVRDCFRGVREHLADGGEFLFDVWLADAFHAAAAGNDYRDDEEAITRIEHRGRVWEVYERSRLRRARRRLDVHYLYVPSTGGAIVDCLIQQRYAPSAELRSDLAAAGLRVDAQWGEFDLRRFTRRATRWIVRAKAVASDEGR
ncbi:MAG TPA: class I SAM-dependent methyltransferase [Polyangiaceae bacterium]|nr:class I SAM-dependent methyltransferase [Polyangiaceae bacterium]